MKRFTKYIMAALVLLYFLPRSVFAQQQVTSFTLINATTDQPVSGFNPIPNGATINLATIGTTNLNIRANTSPSVVGSVRFAFDGNNSFAVESAAPYALFGDNAGNFNGRTIAAGSHTLTATPFTQSGATGTAGTPRTISFTIVNSTSGGGAAVSVVSLTLINADTDRPVPGFDPMPDNATVDLGIIGTRNLSIRANTSPSVVGSVRFALDGNPNFKTENAAPYALNGDNNNGQDFLPANLFAGTHTVTATPFTQANASGTAGTALVRRFTITGTAGNGPTVPASLKTVPVPGPDRVAGFNFGEFVVNKDAAIRLGKALFWDMQAGSDGITACASCHFHAGSDNRAKNQVNPGSNRLFASGKGPNSQLTIDSYPLVKADDDIVGSQGVFNIQFSDIVPGSAVERGSRISDNIFNVNGINTRQVTPRHSTSVINAVYSYRNFWDGRASAIFNGVNEFGPRDANARLLAVSGTGLIQVRVEIPMSTLASQAVGPAMNNTEMIFRGRSFPKLGKKLLRLPPLAKQIVHPNDSRLGTVSNSPNRGLRAGVTYAQMIRDAFNPKWWNSDRVITFSSTGQPIISGPKSTLTTNEFTLMEANFSLFWGLAIQLYEATLVSNNSLFDRVRERTATFTDQQQRGLDLFMGKGRCISCHNGPEFTNASVTSRNKGLAVNRMLNKANQAALYDIGFYNIGIRATGEDLSIGGNDRFGIPFSYSRQLTTGNVRDTFRVNSNLFDIPGAIRAGERVAVNGAFKVPTLRNVELTGPYFHNGGKATLKEVLIAYNAGNNFRAENINDMHPDITQLNLTNQEMNDIVAFLLTLTDPRVRNQSAPFDHPQLFIPNGHPGTQSSVTNDGTGKATDQLIEIPATGASGGITITAFLNASPFVGKPLPEEMVGDLQSEGGGGTADSTETHDPFVATEFLLQQNYPNPFNPATLIKYSLAAESSVKLTVFNALGEEVKVLLDAVKARGFYEAVWDAGTLASGVYFCRIEAKPLDGSKEFISVRKMMLLK